MKVFLLNEMMHCNSASYKIRKDTATALSLGHKVIMISPTFTSTIKPKKILHNDNFIEYTSPGILKKELRRGGFSLLDLLFKVFIILKAKPEVVYTTTGHRPAQLIPTLIAKLLFKAIVIDERWEYYGVGGRSAERRSLLGNVIKTYDQYLERSAINHFHLCITVTERLRDKLGDRNTTMFPGVIDTQGYIINSTSEARRTLGMPERWFVIGALSLGKLDHSDYIPFFEAFGELVIDHPDIRLFCTGEHAYLISFLCKHFPNNLIYKGWLTQAELNKYLSASDMFILPLNPTERNLCRWPIKFNEFLFYKKPVIINPEHEISTLAAANPLVYITDNNVKDIKKSILHLFHNRHNSMEAVMSSDFISFEKKIEFLNGLFNTLK